MSGGIYNFYIQYDNWCTEFALKNTFDSTAMNITLVVNSYLEEGHRIPVPNSRWESDLNSEHRLPPLIKQCPSDPEKTYKDVLHDEYDAIRKRKKKKEA